METHNNPYRTPLVSCALLTGDFEAGPREMVRSIEAVKSITRSGFLIGTLVIGSATSVALPAQANWPQSQEGNGL